MRKYIKIAVLGAVILTSASCKKFLDVNQNPNSPTAASPSIVLPQALLLSANSTLEYNNSIAWIMGYRANAGGYGGFGAEMTYQYTTGTHSVLWSSAYSAINQLDYVINNTSDKDGSRWINVYARIMKSYLYQRLVDQFGDVPYSEAGKGAGNLNPKYDKATDIYKAIYADLDACIAILKASPTGANQVTSASDPIFGLGSTSSANLTASLNNWAKFANTIKLKMVVRAQKVAELSSWVSTAKATLPSTAAEYVDTDVIFNPGYNASTTAQISPKWSGMIYNSTGSASVGAGQSSMPTTWILTYYNGIKLSDVNRGKAIYKDFGKPTQTATINNVVIAYDPPGTNQLGLDVDPILRSTGGSWWWSSYPNATNLTGANANNNTNVVGVFKSPKQGLVLMLAAESRFLQAEAALPSVGLITGVTSSSAFDAGITASYAYLFTNGDRVLSVPATGPQTPAAMLTAYKAENPTSYLVNFNLANTSDKQLEAIIVQKYIALNMINSEEAYNEFRRTGYPTYNPSSVSATETFVSLKGSGNFPNRVLYPTTEFSYNSANVPKGVATSNKIFYAK